MIFKLFLYFYSKLKTHPAHLSQPGQHVPPNIEEGYLDKAYGEHGNTLPDLKGHISTGVGVFGGAWFCFQS